MMKRSKVGFWDNFRHFFVRGLAILLPSVLTIWILMAGYRFVQQNIAAPSNYGVQEAVLRYSNWPTVSDSEVNRIYENPRGRLENADFAEYDNLQDNEQVQKQWIAVHKRRAKLEEFWVTYKVPLDLIGLIIAVVAIYLLGGILGSFIGRRVYRKGEDLIGRVPLIRNVYPSVKQVTDFLVGGGDAETKPKFNRVVAVQYPRRGLWSLGLVTGDTMKDIQAEAGASCVTVFVPSSPTPFTGYVITVPVTETIDLRNVTIEEALRFTISGGVLVPPHQQIVTVDAGSVEPDAGDAPASSNVETDDEEN